MLMVVCVPVHFAFGVLVGLGMALDAGNIFMPVNVQFSGKEEIKLLVETEKHACPAI